MSEFDINHHAKETGWALERALSEINKLTAERDAALAQVEQLKAGNNEIIHVGFTNAAQIHYVVRDKSEGSFFCDTQDGCNIPVYMLATHLRRIDLTKFLTNEEKQQLEIALLSSNQAKGGE